jgi:hemin uptake protein HemP
MGTKQDDVSQSGEKASGEKAKRDAPLEIRFHELSQGNSEVVIEYQNQHYRLRVTRNGKLILNK